MSPDEYAKHQENNKKIYQTVLQEDKRKWLSKMINDEQKYIGENLSPMEINKNVEGEQINVNVKPKINSESTETTSIFSEKFTPENLSSRLSGKNANDFASRLEKLPPEAKQELCDNLNKMLKERFLLKYPGMDAFDDGKKIGVRQPVKREENSDTIVNNIVKRANCFADQSSQKNIELRSNSQTNPEEGEEASKNFVPRG